MFEKMMERGLLVASTTMQDGWLVIAYYAIK